jgi:hypothetical protein
MAREKNPSFQNEDPRISIAALTYLTDREAGKPSQVVQGDPAQPMSITLERKSNCSR